ncbi:hypothetical protein WA1_24115 [Scytonema hofmannii PCC 7110]|uniref:NACHT conflict system C-terminal helical domain-containing protein n=1 Tax=Scytonema hofmannii PCC 7110 TaxID=128403 RepID=A0A139X7Q3_9CYAN|nr:hypothetical protein [Scytonema hofmannii]KYC40728.1 hypothetical protein WA1_24115 [Scytonema hofmannii PCC 7110]USN26953.1 hypothetical protein [synthetic construct]
MKWRHQYGAYYHGNNRELERSLRPLQNQLPDPKNQKAYKQWWLSNGQAWTEQPRSVTISHRNIGHDWQFTDSQKDRS